MLSLWHFFIPCGWVLHVFACMVAYFELLVIRNACCLGTVYSAFMSMFSQKLSEWSHCHSWGNCCCENLEDCGGNL